MIDSVKDLGLYDIDKELEEVDFWKKIDDSLQEKLGLSLETLKLAVGNSIKDRAEEVVLDLPNIAPYGDFGAMLEDNDSMANFLKTEASKPETWKLHSIQDDHENNLLLKFTLWCDAIDDGDVLMGLVFTNKSGVIRHAFTQVNL